MAGKFVAYLRVSTDKQGIAGYGIEGQRADIARHLSAGGWPPIAEFVEVESGKNSARPQLAKALDLCRITGATLLVAKLDRLARDAHFLLGLQKAGIEFVACDNPHATRLTIHILAAVAEEEARLISKRTKDALAAAKARGVSLGGFRGGPKVDSASGRAALVAKADDFAARVGPHAKRLQGEGMNLSQIAAAMNAQGIQTARKGSGWTATSVSRLLARA
jgi:DNA invertase Pin-like site-specific DNA recombinase